MPHGKEGKKNQLNQPTGSLEPCDVVLAYMSLVQPASTHPFVWFFLYVLCSRKVGAHLGSTGGPHLRVKATLMGRDASNI